MPYVLVHANHGDSPNGEYALYYRCAQCANVWAIQKPTAQSSRVHPRGIP